MGCSDMDHFRWARLLLGERIIRFTIEYPYSSARSILPPHKVRCYSTIERIAEGMLISTPSHWHHPVLDKASAKKYEAPGQGGAGASGLPSLLWHLTVSGCTPNVPPISGTGRTVSYRWCGKVWGCSTPCHWQRSWRSIGNRPSRV